MAAPAFGAKVFTTVVFGALGAGVFAGVSHDGRSADPVGDDGLGDSPPIAVSTTSAPSTTVVITTPGVPSSSVEALSSIPVTTVLAAEPAVPDTSRARARVRSGGS
jgi:hypothetical protein